MPVPQQLSQIPILRAWYPDRGQKQQKSSDACAGIQKRGMVRKVTGRLIRLPASLEKREFE
jgi:hypothetical protein